jgi:hypothetical protein
MVHLRGLRLEIAVGMKRFFPSTDEWAMAKTINQCLEIFYKLTTLLSGTSYPMANLFYRGFCHIKDILAK